MAAFLVRWSFVIAVLVVTVGCGGGDNSVVTPGDGYQQTEQEVANEAKEAELRGGGERR